MDLGQAADFESYQREVHKEIAKLRWVENICVIKDDESRHGSYPDFLVIGGQFGKSRPTFGIRGSVSYARCNKRKKNQVLSIDKNNVLGFDNFPVLVSE